MKQNRGAAMVVVAALAVLPAAMAQDDGGGVDDAPAAGGWRLAGGVPAEPCAYPALTLLGVDADGSGIPETRCGATLIADRWVMTAGHCLHAGRQPNSPLLDAAMIRLAPGQPDLSRGATRPIRWISASRLVLYPEYDHETLANDIALIELAEPALPGHCPGMAPMRLADAEAAGLVRPSVEATILGWGWTDTDEAMQETAYVAARPVADLSECRAAWRDQAGDFAITDANLCLGVPGTIGEQPTTCPGDSGGPILARGTDSPQPFVIGIVSWGAWCSQADAVGYEVATRVSAYADWVRAVVETKPEADCDRIVSTRGIGVEAALPLAEALQAAMNDLGLSSQGLALGIRPDGPVSAGGHIQAELQLQAPGYLLLVQVEDDGEVALLYPNPQDAAAGRNPDGWRGAGAQRLPWSPDGREGPDRGYVFAQTETGQPAIVALVSERPLTFAARSAGPRMIVVEPSGAAGGAAECAADAGQALLVDIVDFLADNRATIRAAAVASLVVQ